MNSFQDEAAQMDWEQPLEGTRIGRFLVVRDIEGRTHAIASGAVLAVSDTDDGASLVLSGGRMLQVPQAFGVILRWLDGRS